MTQKIGKYKDREKSAKNKAEICFKSKKQIKRQNDTGVAILILTGIKQGGKVLDEDDCFIKGVIHNECIMYYN